MYKCCQFKRPCAKMLRADRAHWANRVGLEEIKRTRASLKRADNNRREFDTPITRRSGRMEELVTDSTSAEEGDNMEVGIRYLEVSTCTMRGTGESPTSNPSTVSTMGFRSSRGKLANCWESS